MAITKRIRKLALAILSKIQLNLDHKLSKKNSHEEALNILQKNNKTIDM